MKSMSSHRGNAEPIRIGIDTGGTFTDVILVDSSGKHWHVKVRSTPNDSSIGVLDGLQKVLALTKIPPKKVRYILHGTTVATNTVLQRTGAKIRLITTKGFEDLLEIGRQQRPSLYDIFVERIPPLVSRDNIVGVSERILENGTVHQPLSKKEVSEVVNKAVSDIDAMAICLLFSYQNPKHEIELLQEIRRQYPDLPVSISSAILPEYREYERMSTTVLDAYVNPIITKYLQRLDIALNKVGISTPLLIMQSHGGVLQSNVAQQHAARLLFSGLAGGTLGGAYTSDSLQEKEIISLDMGGTSTDVALISNAAIRETSEGHIGGLPCRLPMVDVETVGAGGGSIGWIDTGGILRVGPQSAGADPGPAAYGMGGTDPTVTDANLLLGRLNPENFLGGTISLRMNLAEESIQTLADELYIAPAECAFGIIRVVNANMERAIRVVSIQRGFDPRDFALVAFGGAGPMHAWALAKNLGIPRVIIPPAPGLHSALGLLATNLRVDKSQTVLESLKSPNLTRITSVYNQLEDVLREQLGQQGVESDSMSFQRFADLRYTGQAYEIVVPVPKERISKKWVSRLNQSFHLHHEHQYGFAAPTAPVTIVNLRVIAQGPMPTLKLAKIPVQHGTPEILSRREIFYEEIDGFATTPVFDRVALGLGVEIEGPAIIEQLDSTTVVHPNTKAVVRKGGNIILEELN